MATIDSLLQNLVETGGSDLHLSEGEYPKTRIHGAIALIPDQELLTHERIHTLLSEICDPKAFEHYLETGDLDFAYGMNEQSRFRCNYNQAEITCPGGPLPSEKYFGYPLVELFSEPF